MRRILGVLLALLWVICLEAGPNQGIPPRKSPGDFPQQKSLQDFSIGVALLAKDQVRGQFASDLNRGFLVVEVGIYPEKGKSIDLRRRDFVLRTRKNEVLGRPADPIAIAASLQKAAGSDRDVTLFPSATIGYESGPRYDPVTGTRRGGGVYTGAGVGVGVGGSAPAATDRDRRTMEMELSEKSLPEDHATLPVSGYLYFPLKDRKKGETYILEYTGQNQPLLLQVLPDGGSR